MNTCLLCEILKILIGNMLNSMKESPQFLPFLVVYHILSEAETWSFLRLLPRMNSSEMQYKLGIRRLQINSERKNGIGCYSPEKLCHNRICCPSNRSKQVQETHTAYIADTQYTRQSLNEKQHTWLHRQCHEWHIAEKVNQSRNQSTMVEVIAMQVGHKG